MLIDQKELFDFEDLHIVDTNICSNSLDQVYLFQQVSGNAILFNAEMKFPIRANMKVGQKKLQIKYIQGLK